LSRPEAHLEGMEDLLEEIGKELSPAEARETYETLAKVLGNILANPGEAKFRSLKKDNKVIAVKILRSNNAASLLLAMGFEDEGGAYRLEPDADLETMRTVHELLECLLLSSEDLEPPSTAEAKEPAVAAVAAVAAVTAVAAVAAAEKPAVVANPQAFGRRNEAETKRQEQIDQLQAARAAQRAQYTENPQGPAAGPAILAAQAGGYPAASTADAKKKSTGNTSFDFKNRNQAEQEKIKGEQSLEAIRKAQKDKFKDWQSDPNAPKQQALKLDPSVSAPTAKAEDNGWFGGWFGGSSSSGNTKPAPERRNPRIKGVADLPKPVQRGGG